MHESSTVGSSTSNNDIRNDYKEYLGRQDIKNKLYSDLGEIKDSNFLRELLKDCDRLTICGHTGDGCHHTSFEDVIAAYDSDPTQFLTIAIPTYAVSSLRSSEYAWSLAKEIAEAPYLFSSDLKIPVLLERYTEDFTRELTPKDKVLLRLLYQYIKTAILSVDKFSLEISTDNRDIFILNGGQTKRLKLSFDNNGVRNEKS